MFPPQGAGQAASTTYSGMIELATEAEVITGSSTALAVTPKGLNDRTATAARTGIVELATEAEVVTGSDTQRAVTPKGLNDRVATEAQTGIAELATNAEALTGTDTGRVITPEDLDYVLDRRNINQVNLFGNSGFGVWSNSDTNKGLSRGTPTENVSVDSGSTLPVVGETLTGATSGAVGKVISITDSGGDWGANTGTGTLSLGACTGRLQDNEDLNGSTASANCCTLNMPPTAAGVDLMRNGDFTADEDPPQGWTASNATLSTEAGGDVGNCMKVLDGGAGNGYGYQAITTVIGKLYTFSCYAKDIDTGQNGLIEVGTAAGNAAYYSSGAVTNDAGATYTVTFEATTTTTVITLNCTSAAGAYYFDSVSLYEITPCCTAGNVLAPDGWDRASTLDVFREHSGSNTKDGAFYAVKMVKGADTAEWFEFPPAPDYNLIEWYKRFRSRTVTFGVWIKTDVAGNVRLNIYDGTATQSSYHTGGGTYEWLEVTRTVSASATTFRIRIDNEKDLGDIAYASQPMLVFGSSIGEGNHVQMPGEVIRFKKDVIPTDYNTTACSDVDTELNIEAQTEGKVPKGVKGLYLTLKAMDAVIAANIGVWMGPDTTYCAQSIGDVGIFLEGLANDKRGSASGWVRCDSGGDPWLFINASGTDTLDLEIRIQGVRLW